MGVLDETARRGLRLLGHQHWLPFGVRDRVIRRVVPPGTPGAFSVDFFGGRYTGDLGSYIDWMVYFYGAYERGELLFLGDLCRALGAGITVLDIGANVGHHTLFLAGLAEQVHAFEPWPTAADAVERRVRENGLINVVLHRVGLGDRDEERTYYVPNTGNLGTGSFHPENSPGNVPLGALSIRRGDDVLTAHGVARVDLVKMDIEGHELHALAGLRDTLEHQRPIVVMELGPVTTAALGPGSILDHLPRDYVALHLQSSTGGYALRPFETRGPNSNIVLAPRERQRALPKGRVALVEGRGRVANVVNAVGAIARR